MPRVQQMVLPKVLQVCKSQWWYSHEHRRICRAEVQSLLLLRITWKKPFVLQREHGGVGCRVGKGHLVTTEISSLKLDNNWSETDSSGLRVISPYCFASFVPPCEGTARFPQGSVCSPCFSLSSVFFAVGFLPFVERWIHILTNCRYT